MATRNVAQVVVKTLITYAFGIANFSQTCALQRVPWKHNSRIFRIAIFFFLPGIAFGQLLVNLLQAAARLLQHLLDADLESFKIDYPFLKACFHGALGVYAREEKLNETTQEQDPKTSKLLDVPLTSTSKLKHTSWTWARYGQILATLLALTQAVGSLVVFGQRYYKSEVVGIDCRNYWIASGSVVSAVLSLFLLILGNDWTFEPDANSILHIPSEPKKIVLELLVGAVFQQIIQYDLDDHRRFGFTRFSMLEILWHAIPGDVIEILICTAFIFALIVFRKEFATRLNLSLRLVNNITILLMIISFGWTVIDVLISFVEDMISFKMVTWDGVNWSNPLEEMIPII